MKNMIALFFGFIVLTGCKTPCTIETNAASGISGAIANTLQCSNSAAINSDMMKLLDKAGTCSVATPAVRGIIGSTVCPLLGNLVVSELGNQVPAAWECSLTNAKGGLNLLVSTACAAVPF